MVARREGTSRLELVVAFETKRRAAGILIMAVCVVFVTFLVVFTIKTIVVVAWRQFGGGCSCHKPNIT